MTQIALVGINSKYIHPNMAIRILQNDLKNHQYKSDIIEYSSKKDLKEIVNELTNYPIVCFSIYIYNIKIVQKLIAMLRKQNPQQIIILGGPEVSYLSKEQALRFNVDYIVCGEGEKALVNLIKQIDKKQTIDNKYVISFFPELKMNEAINQVEYEYTFDLINDFSSVNLNNQIAYLETSRGCPYLCAYCLASLDNQVRMIDLNKVKASLQYLLDQKAKIVKLLDRTFNYDVSRTNEIIEYIIENDNNFTTFQFEITGELLADSSIDLINQKARKDLFRFEIGVQSTNKKANEAINRYQDFKRLAKVIEKIKAGNKVVLHLDLIAGLPYEDLKSFQKTFNEVFTLYPDELQLGFLKLLKGTTLNQQLTSGAYQFDEQAPYEIKENRWLSQNDLKIIENVEHGLNAFYNHSKCHDSIIYILTKYELDPFSTFNILSKHIYKDNEVYNLLSSLLSLDIEFCEDDMIVLLNNYYSKVKHRPKTLTDVENKHHILRVIIEQENLNAKTTLKFGCVEKIGQDSYYVYMLDNEKRYLVKTMKDRYVNEI